MDIVWNLYMYWRTNSYVGRAKQGKKKDQERLNQTLPQQEIEN